MKVIQLFNNEPQLIRRAAKGNREAQHRLFERYSGKMLSVCRQYINDLQHAEEVMLNGFFKVFKYLGDFKGEGSFEGWVRRIMVREAITFLRKSTKIEFLEEQFGEVETIDGHTSVLEVNFIQSLIDSLPEGYKMVFLMYCVDGYKHSEIAKALNISEGTSKSQLFKARKLLQEKLEHENSTDYGTRKI